MKSFKEELNKIEKSLASFKQLAERFREAEKQMKECAKALEAIRDDFTKRKN